MGRRKPPNSNHHRHGPGGGGGRSVSLNYYQFVGANDELPAGGGGGKRTTAFSLVRLLFGLTIGGSIVYMYVGYLINSFECVDTASVYGPCLPSALVGGNISISDYDAIAPSMVSRVMDGANKDVIQWSRGSSCGAVAPCRYPDEVNLRIIVLVMNRFRSLRRLLDSLEALKMDSSETSALEIWIDRDNSGRVSQRVYDVATSFVWRYGPTRVYVRRAHVGLYGQWMQTWRPRNDSQDSGSGVGAEGELALILEDDLSVSPHAWRWIRAMHAAFGHRTDIAGYTLQSENVNRADGKGPLPVHANDTTFLYGIIGSWGFVPHPARWAQFVDWYERVHHSRFFKPYVKGFFQTDWYRKFEKDGRQNTMWTMWFIRFCVDNALSVVYSNLSSLVNVLSVDAGGMTSPGRGQGAHNASGAKSKGKIAGPGSLLAVHRQEPGLHFFGKPRDGSNKLLRTWNDDYLRMLTPDSFVRKYDYFNGTWSWSRVAGDITAATDDVKIGVM